MKLLCYETPTLSNVTLSDVYVVLCYVFVAASMIYTDDLLFSKGSSRKGYAFVYTSQSDYFIQHMHRDARALSSKSTACRSHLQVS
jgi:hypothetical protein